MSEEVHETPSTTPNFQTELAAQLAELMPEAIADGKIDVEKLKELLDGDAADTSERFGLFWPGKKRALRAAQEPTTATLRPDFENSKDWDTTKNVFIEGDNLEVLKILQKHYHAKIKMIYIDPPYNTGKDFVYPDNYKEGLDTYLEWTRQVNEEGKKLSTNAETEGRYHSNWLNMMYPRLKLARNLLRQDGLIFVSIDDSEQPHLRRLMDEVFGENNFINVLVVRRQDKNLNLQFIDQGLRTLNTGYEYVLVYSRGKQGTINPVRVALQNSNRASSGYWKGFWNAPDRPTMRYDILGFTPEEGQWKWKPEKAHEAIQNYERFLAEENSSMTLEQYWEANGKKLSFIRRQPNGRGKNGGVEHWVAPSADKLRSTNWTDMLVMRKPSWLNLPFDSPKNPDFIKELIRMGADSESLILDFFAGSSSTAHAVLEMNAEDGGSRRFIQVQLPEPTPAGSDAEKAGFQDIAAISRDRIRQVGDRLAAEVAGSEVDSGFRAFKLSDTNFSKWKVSSDVDRNQLEQHLFALRESSSADDASADDLLSEILLKQGYSMTEKFAPVDVAGLNLRSVGDGIVLAYLNEHIKPTLEQLRAVIDENPERLIFLEDAFQGDDQLKTNLAQLCKSKGIELWTA